jgi:hypothetical protein
MDPFSVTVSLPEVPKGCFMAFILAIGRAGVGRQRQFAVQLPEKPSLGKCRPSAAGHEGPLQSKDMANVPEPALAPVTPDNRPPCKQCKTSILRFVL